MSTGLRDVERLMRPTSIVAIGPSPRNPSVVANLLACPVPVLGVHPTRDQVLGLDCVPDLAQVRRTDRLPHPPDLAVLLVGHTRVVRVFEEALALGIRAFVIPGVGSEAGADGPRVAAQLRRLAEQAGAAVLGQNCMGVASPGGSAWIGSLGAGFVPGDVAVLAQSGSIAEALTTAGPRIGFRRVVSVGAELNRDVADLLAWQATEPGTRAIGLFLETVRRPAAFIRALAATARAEIPVVCLKVGRSAVAERIAVAHTGAVVGSAQAFSAVLRRFGVIEVDDVTQLVETLDVLGRRRRPRGVRVGAVSESGGECELLADRAERHGLELAELPPPTAEALRAEFANLPEPQNPMDAWGVDDAERVFPRALELIAAGGGYDTLVAQVDLSRFRGALEAVWCELAVRSVAASANAHGLAPAVVSATTADPPDAIARVARELDVPLLRGIDNACFALASAGRWRSTHDWRPFTRPQVAGGAADGTGESTGETTGGEGGGVALPEFESAALLERYDIPVASRRRAADPSQAARAAQDLGFPVVVKRDGPAHKSRDGGVVLNLTTPDEVAAAAARLGGPVLVAAQLPPGPEAFCGLTRDPRFGPILAIGRGGSQVEAQRPVTCLAPVDLDLARRLVDLAWPSESTGPPGPTRPAGSGSPAAERLAATLVALSRIATEHPRIVEVDINPLILSATGAVAVDALVVADEGTLDDRG